MTLNDLERRNGRVVCIISPNSAAFRDHYVKWLKIERHILRVKCSLKNLVFSGISLIAIFTRESVKVKRPPVAHIISHNLETVQDMR